MNIDNLVKEVKKLKYQVHLLGNIVDYQTHPIESLILSMDWSEEDIDSAHDIFEKYNNKLEANQPVTWNEFESELKNEFNIGYQNVKHIVLAFFNNNQWTDVCYKYAMSFEPTTPVEFHQITRREK